jgi:hypothetical protein
MLSDTPKEATDHLQDRSNSISYYFQSPSNAEARAVLSGLHVSFARVSSAVSICLNVDFVCIPMEHYPLGNGDLTNVSVGNRRSCGKLTILSWVSFRAESFASTASSVYAISIAVSQGLADGKNRCAIGLQLFEGRLLTFAVFLFSQDKSSRLARLQRNNYLCAEQSNHNMSLQLLIYTADCWIQLLI